MGDMGKLRSLVRGSTIFQNYLQLQSMAKYKGWRFGMLIGGLVAAIGAVLYPTVVAPIIDPEPYKIMREQTRAKIREDKRL